MTTPTNPTIDDYFPKLNVPLAPFMDQAIVQLRRIFPKTRTVRGVFLPDDTTEDQRREEEWHETIGKIVAVGPAFSRNRDNLTPWPEGIIAEVGDFVRVPEFAAGKFSVKSETGYDIKCMFVKDTSIMAKVTDPIAAIDAVKTYKHITERK